MIFLSACASGDGEVDPVDVGDEDALFFDPQRPGPDIGWMGEVGIPDAIVDVGVPPDAAGLTDAEAVDAGVVDAGAADAGDASVGLDADLSDASLMDAGDAEASDATPINGADAGPDASAPGPDMNFFDPCRDEDRDGVSVGAECPAGPVDCDDGDPDVRPGGTEVCGGVDEDCDGRVDEAGCGLHILLDHQQRWVGRPMPPGGPVGDWVDAFSVPSLDEVQVIAGGQVHLFDPLRARWTGALPLEAVFPEAAGVPIKAATGVPRWWVRQIAPMAAGDQVHLFAADRILIYEVDPETRGVRLVQVQPAPDRWMADHAPAFGDLLGGAFEPTNADGRWPGIPRWLCGAQAERLSTLRLFLTSGRWHLEDLVACQSFLPGVLTTDWPDGARPGAPGPAALARTLGLARHQPRGGGLTAGWYIFVSPEAD